MIFILDIDPGCQGQVGNPRNCDFTGVVGARAAASGAYAKNLCGHHRAMGVAGPRAADDGPKAIGTRRVDHSRSRRSNQGR